jgi:diaminopimelate decarboxylase
VSGPAARFLVGGVPLDHALAALRRIEPAARAFYIYDLDLLLARARRFLAAFAAFQPMVAYALKANALPALLEPLARMGLGADAASLGELEAAQAAGFAPGRRVLNGNGKSPEEIEWAAARGVHSVNADGIAELDALERAAQRQGAPLRVALRVNPGIATAGHPFVATGDADAKFGVTPAEALEAWSGRSRWPRLRLDGLHLHVGSQVLDPGPLREAAAFAIRLAAEAAGRGSPLGLLNLGGGLGVDYGVGGREFPLEGFASELAAVLDPAMELVLEPGRWLVAPAGVLAAEVLWVKTRGRRRFVVLAAGMNDLLRPALYGARHRIEPVRPRPGPRTPAAVVGPLCESADVFDPEAPLPPLEPGDLVAVLDAGAYGASMASNYNGRGRLPELVASGGRLVRARAGEPPAALAGRRAADPLEL